MPQQPVGGLQLKTAPGGTNQTMGKVENPRDAWSQGLNAAADLGGFVRAEHGREGVKRYVSALLPFVPYSMIESLSRALDVPTPSQGVERPVRVEEDKPPAKPAMSPEQMLALMQALGGGQKGGGGLDPKLLLQLLGN